MRARSPPAPLLAVQMRGCAARNGRATPSRIAGQRRTRAAPAPRGRRRWPRPVTAVAWRLQPCRGGKAPPRPPAPLRGAVRALRAGARPCPLRPAGPRRSGWRAERQPSPPQAGRPTRAWPPAPNRRAAALILRGAAPLGGFHAPPACARAGAAASCRGWPGRGRRRRTPQGKQSGGCGSRETS